MTAIERLYHAYLDEIQKITILLPRNYHNGFSSRFTLRSSRDSMELEIVDCYDLPDCKKYVCTSSYPPEIGDCHTVFDEHGGSTDLQIGAVIRTEAFDETFSYNGELGVDYSRERTVFKVWSPTATKLQLILAQPGSGSFESFEMVRKTRGIWKLEVEGNLEYYRYRYRANINLVWNEAVDPYARAIGENGEYGVVVDMEKTTLPSKHLLPRFENPCDAVIYEVHIRDLTSHQNSGTMYKGKYRGAADSDTVSSAGISTGLSYLAALGVTHVEFLPFNDFEGVDERNPDKQYNWGYNPVHFNLPEGSYATDPDDPYCRINELKQLIKKSHEHGIRVIMDVVYNHVYIRENSVFEKLVPGYFFRHDEHGMPSNGTGVGNDFASERRMGRKFIVDSVAYWMKEYEVDGFRFDLMGILDIETMLEVRAAADCIDKTALIIGEGWDLNTPIPDSCKANIGNQLKLPRIGHFNDWFRDTIKGSTFNLYDKGYAMGNERYGDAAKQVIAGSVGVGRRKAGLFLEPIQSVNYIESHDNHTLWDKLAIIDPELDVMIQKKRHSLATSIVLLSQGIPFIHAGQEFFRTKQGIGNSYKSPDTINWLDWDLRDDNLKYINYFKGIISIRHSHRAFRLPDTQSIRKHLHFMDLDLPIIGYWLKDVEELGAWGHIAVIINPSPTAREIPLPDVGEWHVLADDTRASSNPARKMSSLVGSVAPYSLLVVASRHQQN
ncbi:type I pullulanase [Bacillus massilinigeriensis]|uniref:type I pullulanase n=1 Tax=Bacillus mediterraneensis TaxID=1805474 RepID=UPI0008F94586|nr:type I pullulanase [Bacillus mediterraneensis]